ncbi:glycoside hydrolase family 78 protein [Candidatus Hydrogenedentota bacterium]
MTTALSYILTSILLAIATPEAPEAPTNLKCEYRTAPQGIDIKKPLLSWEVNDPRRGAVQAACQILVASRLDLLNVDKGDVWDTGKLPGDVSINVVYEGKSLESGREYFWKVRTWDGNDKVSSYSEPATWSMGLLEASDWAGEWISMPGSLEKLSEEDDKAVYRSSTYLRKNFDVGKGIERAVVYVTGLGMYELSLNGEKVGTDIMTPGWTDYRKRVQYQTYDVTHALQEGNNAVGAVLGSGWWHQRFGWKTAFRYSETFPCLMLTIVIEYADGTKGVISTDDTWRAHKSPILENSIYFGETYDARLEIPGWNRPGFDDSEWAPAVSVDHVTGKLVAQRCAPIRVTEEIPVVKITQPSEGVYIYDFGQNMAGKCRFKVNGPRGTRIQTRVSENLYPNGTLDNANYRSAVSTDVYILKGEDVEIWEPKFTYRGFRYVELTGNPGTPTKDTLTALALHTATPKAGKFECSNDLLNKIYKNTLWGQRSNMHSVLTDCPQRDERLGWTGDGQAFVATACWNMDMASFLAKWETDISDSLTEEGDAPNMAPEVVDRFPGSPGWGDAITIVPWTLYQYYGDKRVIEDNFDSMKAWVECMRRRSKDNLYALSGEKRTFQGYGDWLATDKTPRKLIAAAFYYHSTDLVAKMAEVIGREEDAKLYAGLAEDIREAFNKAYIKKDYIFLATADYGSGSQTSNLLPMSFGLVPEEKRAGVMDKVRRDVLERDNHLSTGFLGTPFLLPELTKAGHHEIAYKVAIQDTHPSWGHMISQGATTIWERWDSDTNKGRMNSRNHFAFGAVVEWFYESLAGINLDPDNPGFKHVTVYPRPAGDLTWARARYASPYGTIQSGWRIEGDMLLVNVDIPANANATIHILSSEPGTVKEGGAPATEAEGVVRLGMEEGTAVYRVGSGSYSFAAKK